jgi:hypothetical protein
LIRDVEKIISRISVQIIEPFPNKNLKLYFAHSLVTADGTKVLTVEKYDRFIGAIPESMKAIFDINTITGLRYISFKA